MAEIRNWSPQQDAALRAVATWYGSGRARKQVYRVFGAAAIVNGFELRSSDDFNIGVIQDGRLISLDWMEEPVDTDPALLAKIQKRGW